MDTIQFAAVLHCALVTLTRKETCCSVILVSDRRWSYASLIGIYSLPAATGNDHAHKNFIAVGYPRSQLYNKRQPNK